MFAQGGTYHTPGDVIPASLSHLPPARIKRILANRESAARSKQRKLDYMMELENQVTHRIATWKVFRRFGQVALLCMRTICLLY